jgi:hypothetical protein
MLCGVRSQSWYSRSWPAARQRRGEGRGRLLPECYAQLQAQEIGAVGTIAVLAEADQPVGIDDEEIRRAG